MSSYYDNPHENPYWQNLNGNDRQDDLNRQNTRNTDPNWHPEPEYGRQLGKTAAILGGFSIVTCFFMPVVVPAIFGGIAIVMAIISRGRGNTFTRSARHGVVLGTIGLSINLAMLIAMIVVSWQMVYNPDMRAQANQVMEQLYGISFDDMLQQVEQDTGLDLETTPSEESPAEDGNSVPSFQQEEQTLPESIAQSGEEKELTGSMAFFEWKDSGYRWEEAV